MIGVIDEVMIEVRICGVIYFSTLYLLLIQNNEFRNICEVSYRKKNSDIGNSTSSSADFVSVGSPRVSSHIPEDRPIEEMHEEDAENAKYEVAV